MFNALLQTFVNAFEFQERVSRTLRRAKMRVVLHQLFFVRLARAYPDPNGEFQKYLLAKLHRRVNLLTRALRGLASLISQPVSPFHLAEG